MNILEARISGIPVWVWVLGGGAAIVGIVWWMRRQNGSSGGGVLGQNPSNAVAAVDPNIDSNTGIPYSIEEAINPSTGLPAYYGGPGVDTNLNGLTGPTGSVQQPAPTPTPTPTSTPPVQQPAPTPTPAPVTTPPSGPSIRARATDPNNGNYGYDANHPEGVPLWNAPGGQQIGAVAFGSPLSLSGGAISGSFPLASGGYVHAGDVQNAPAMGRAAGRDGLYQATPFWPEMTDLYAGRH